MKCDIISVLRVRKSVVICPRLTRRCETTRREVLGYYETVKIKFKCEKNIIKYIFLKMMIN